MRAPSTTPPAHRPSMRAFRQTTPSRLLWDMLTFDRLVTGPIIHMVYWAGLALIVLAGFSVVGGAVGMALREPGIMKLFLAVAVGVAGLFVLAIVAMIWRTFCEFYVSIFRIGDDLHALRRAVESQGGLGVKAPVSGDDLTGKI